ncbi:unnamed protein product [Porites evermanni]|uniref:G-protein coupled receptors family 1 profile domain-containing protein n=1 Tax=Porites evermanni TaxID=104178 RepID=A0ABN8N6F7_9CNID|nr:unnamed protein product [Porites evermanni]
MYLVISLTVADMLVGVPSGDFFQFVLDRRCRLVKLNLSWEVSISLSSFNYFFALVSLTNIAVISLERFHATFRPFRHRLIKRWVYVVAIVVVWVFSCNCFSHLDCAAALRQRKLTVTLFITTLVSLLLWLPYNIFLFVDWSTDILNSLSFKEYFDLIYSLSFFFSANSLVNPILYTIRMLDFKRALLSWFRRHQRENVAIPLNRY